MTHTPTPADIETLREAVDGCGGPSYTQALAILDRLSPPAPEVDEATRILRELWARGYEAQGRQQKHADRCRAGEYDKLAHFIAELTYLRTVLSELAVLRAENEPPAGYGGIKLACKDTYFDFNGIEIPTEGGWSFLSNVHVNITPIAAERNTAEPENKTVFVTGLQTDSSKHLSPTAEPATDTTPEVVVTQTARDIASGIMKERGLKRSNGYAYTIALQAAAEAEARGRRAALEEARKRVWERLYPENPKSDWTRYARDRADAAEAADDELKRLMTEPKP